MSRPHLVDRTPTGNSQPVHYVGQPGQINPAQYVQSAVDKIYWDRAPVGYSSAQYVRTAGNTGNAVPQTATTQAQWSPIRQPIIPYMSYATRPGPQLVSNAQTEYLQQPYYQSTVLTGSPTMISTPSGYMQRQYLQTSPFGAQYPMQVTSPHYEPVEISNNANPGIATYGVPQNVASQYAVKGGVSLGTPAVVTRDASREMTTPMPAHVEEVDVEVVVAQDSPLPASARSDQPADTTSTSVTTGSFQPAAIPLGGISAGGSLTARAVPTRLTYEAPFAAPAMTDRLVLTTHQRTTSSPAAMSPREQTTTLMGMPHNLSSDLLKVGMFWPVLNPLIDLLKLIEVVDYNSSTSFRSLILAVSPDSDVKKLGINFGDSSNELVLTLKPIEEQAVVGLALIKCALHEDRVITMRSLTTGSALKIRVKQLLISGLTACQGKYLLSDTESIKLGVQLSFNSYPADALPSMCVCPPSITFEFRVPPQDSVNAGGATSAEVGKELPTAAAAAVDVPAGAPSTTLPEPVVVVPRHVRECSADCVKAGSRPIPSVKLFLADGMPTFNRLIVKVEGFEGFKDIGSLKETRSVFLRASLGGGTKGFRCRIDNWLTEEAHAEFDFDYRGNRTLKFSILDADDEDKRTVGTTQLNLLALLALSKNQFHGSLPVNCDGRVLGRLKVGVLYTNASTTAPPATFKAFSWRQALSGGSFIRIHLHWIHGSLQAAHDPLFFRMSCGSVKVRSSKFSPARAANSMNLQGEVMEMPITPELLMAAEQKDLILCVYSRYNAETACHTASHYTKVAPSIIGLPSPTPRLAKIADAIMTPASQEFASEDFIVNFSFEIL